MEDSEEDTDYLKRFIKSTTKDMNLMKSNINKLKRVDNSEALELFSQQIEAFDLKFIEFIRNCDESKITEEELLIIEDELKIIKKRMKKYEKPTLPMSVMYTIMTSSVCTFSLLKTF